MVRRHLEPPPQGVVTPEGGKAGTGEERANLDDIRPNGQRPLGGTVGWVRHRRLDQLAVVGRRVLQLSRGARRAGRPRRPGHRPVGSDRSSRPTPGRRAAASWTEAGSTSGGGPNDGVGRGPPRPTAHDRSGGHRPAGQAPGGGDRSAGPFPRDLDHPGGDLGGGGPGDGGRSGHGVPPRRRRPSGTLADPAGDTFVDGVRRSPSATAGPTSSRPRRRTSPAAHVRHAGPAAHRPPRPTSGGQPTAPMRSGPWTPTATPPPTTRSSTSSSTRRTSAGMSPGRGRAARSSATSAPPPTAPTATGSPSTLPASATPPRSPPGDHLLRHEPPRRRRRRRLRHGPRRWLVLPGHPGPRRASSAPTSTG